MHNDKLIIICIYPVRDVLCMLYIMLYYYIVYDLYNVYFIVLYYITI